MSKDDFTIFAGNLHEKVTEEILYELFLQAGPVDEVRIPIHNGVKKSYGFIQFKHEVSVPYALHLLDGIRVFDRQLKLNSRSSCLHLFRPPPRKRIERRRSREETNDMSSLRGIGGGARKRFVDKSMMPSGPARKRDRFVSDDSPSYDQPSARHIFFKDDSPPNDQSSSLRYLGASSTGQKRFMDKSMMPKGPSRNSTKSSQDDSSFGKGWSPKNYPSQFEDPNDTPKGYERGSNGLSRNRNRYEHGNQKHKGKPYNMMPHFNEKHNNRDKNRFDSYPSQRSRHHRPYNH